MNLWKNLDVFGKIQKSAKLFPFHYKKVIKIDKDVNESAVTISYKINFTDKARYMTTSNLIDSLTEGNHEIKCKVCDFFLEYESVKNNLIKHKCLS